MNHVIATTVAAAALIAPGLAVAADQEVEVRHAVARVVVVVEDRSDVAVEIEQGSSSLPALEVRRRGGNVRIDGGLGSSRFGFGGSDGIRSCRSGPPEARQPGEGASVEVRNHGRINMEDAPLVVVRTPRDVEVNVRGAVFGAIGRGATVIDFGNAGCGDWTIANTGRLEISQAGSGDVRAGTSSRLDVSVAGSGNITAGATGALDVSVAGSGDVQVAAVDGPIDVSIAGSGDFRVGGGRVGHLDVSIAGSGNVDVDATVTSVNVSVMGSGDVRVAGVTGAIEQSIMGSGRVTVGDRVTRR